MVPTNFFAQPESREVSAMLFSNPGTLTKLNRMGVRAGFGDPAVTLTRRGILNDPSPGAFEGIPFEVNVQDPDYVGELGRTRSRSTEPERRRAPRSGDLRRRYSLLAAKGRTRVARALAARAH